MVQSRSDMKYFMVFEILNAVGGKRNILICFQWVEVSSLTFLNNVREVLRIKKAKGGDNSSELSEQQGIYILNVLTSELR